MAKVNKERLLATMEERLFSAILSHWITQRREQSQVFYRSCRKHASSVAGCDGIRNVRDCHTLFCSTSCSSPELHESLCCGECKCGCSVGSIAEGYVYLMMIYSNGSRDLIQADSWIKSVATPTISAQLGFDCLNSVSLHAPQALALVDSIVPFVQWQTGQWNFRQDSILGKPIILISAVHRPCISERSSIRLSGTSRRRHCQF